MSQRDSSARNKRTPSLAERLQQRIKREGAITFRDWMAAALYDPEEGYYCRRDLPRWGSSGDYLTSPERSPLFAATFARYFSQLYEQLGAPNSWTIIEAGAGPGQFAAGVLDALQQQHPKVFAATRYVIDEASPDARERAQARLSAFASRVEFRRLKDLSVPVGEAVVFANELLDAFPIHRVIVRGGRLLELGVGCNAAGGFIWVAQPPSTPRLAEYFQALQLQLAEGQTAEVNLAAVDWIAKAASVFRRGFLITVDYGAEADELFSSTARPSGTLRAFHQHQFADDVLAQPGAQDLTTTVDWTSIRKAGAAAGLHIALYERQDNFLLQAGLLEELELRSATARSEAEAVSLRAGARHMILPDSMSASFQVLVQSTLPVDN